MPIWFWWVSLLGWVDSRSWTASSTNSNEVFICPPPYLFKARPLRVAITSVCPSGTQKWRMSTTEYAGFTISNTMPSRCHFFSDWFFCESVQAPVQRFLLSTKVGGGGNLENETASTSSIVPVDIHYASREKRTLFQTPEITLISSAQRLAASAVEIKTKKEK